MCAEGILGDHMPSGWNNSSTELSGNHMLRAWLVKWLQPMWLTQEVKQE